MRDTSYTDHTCTEFFTIPLRSSARICLALQNVFEPLSGGRLQWNRQVRARGSFLFHSIGHKTFVAFLFFYTCHNSIRRFLTFVIIFAVAVSNMTHLRQLSFTYTGYGT